MAHTFLLYTTPSSSPSRKQTFFRCIAQTLSDLSNLKNNSSVNLNIELQKFIPNIRATICVAITYIWILSNKTKWYLPSHGINFNKCMKPTLTFIYDKMQQISYGWIRKFYERKLIICYTKSIIKLFKSFLEFHITFKWFYFLHLHLCNYKKLCTSNIQFHGNHRCIRYTYTSKHTLEFGYWVLVTI